MVCGFIFLLYQFNWLDLFQKNGCFHGNHTRRQSVISHLLPQAIHLSTMSFPCVNTLILNFKKSDEIAKDKKAEC